MSLPKCISFWSQNRNCIPIHIANAEVKGAENGMPERRKNVWCLAMRKQLTITVWRTIPIPHMLLSFEKYGGSMVTVQYISPKQIFPSSPFQKCCSINVRKLVLPKQDTVKFACTSNRHIQAIQFYCMAWPKPYQLYDNKSQIFILWDANIFHQYLIKMSF